MRSRVIAVLVLLTAALFLAASVAEASGAGRGRRKPQRQPFFHCLAADESPAQFHWPWHSASMSPIERWIEHLFRRVWRHRQNVLANWRVDHCTHLNEIQVLGTHNSFKIQPSESLLRILTQFIGDLALGFEYSHIPLDQ